MLDHLLHPSFGDSLLDLAVCLAIGHVAVDESQCDRHADLVDHAASHHLEVVPRRRVERPERRAGAACRPAPVPPAPAATTWHSRRRKKCRWESGRHWRGQIPAAGWAVAAHRNRDADQFGRCARLRIQVVADGILQKLRQLARHRACEAASAMPSQIGQLLWRI